ncbi:MAG TPA: hypothetical protein VHC90_11030 [Bryobacteraceae bacterium]|nr:hypothetical protein [Bryobacteraceae bacterium]
MNTRATAESARAIAASLAGHSVSAPGGGVTGSVPQATGLNGVLAKVSSLLHLSAGPTGIGSDYIAPSASYSDDPYAGLPVSAPGSTADGGAYDSSVGLPSGVSSGTFGTVAGGVLGLAGGAMEIAQGVQQGGVGGALKMAGGAAAAAGTAISAVAKLASAVSPALSAAGPVGMALGAGLSLIGSLFSSGPEQYAKKVATELSKNQYLAPTALNVTESPNGTYSDFDSRGNLRTSNLNALPTVAEPYVTSRRIDGVLQYGNAPGYTIKPFSGPTAQPQVHVHISAIDTQTGVDFLMKNHQAVGESLATHLQMHEGRASNEIRNITRG